MNSAPMINKCFRHQHPEAFGEMEVAEPDVPASLRYGLDRLPDASPGYLAEEITGFPDARLLPE